MSYKDVLRVFKLERELNDDETATLNTLRKMSVADIEATVEAFGGSMGKSSKSSKPATKRVYERCVGCGTTKGNEVHKNLERRDYHLFEPPPQPVNTAKSKRASSLAGAIKKKSGDKEPRCVACYEIATHSNHDLDNGGHKFETSVSARAAKALEKYNEDDSGNNSEERCTATREDGRICNLLVDHNVHQMKTAMGYHEFVGSETAVGASGD